MNNSNNKNKSYWQTVIFRGSLRLKSFSWPGTSRLLVVHVPISDPDGLAVIGVGSYFESFFADEALCICLRECTPDAKEKDLKPLVEYLRSTGS